MVQAKKHNSSYNNDNLILTMCRCRGAPIHFFLWKVTSYFINAWIEAGGSKRRGLREHLVEGAYNFKSCPCLTKKQNSMENLRHRDYDSHRFLHHNESQSKPFEHTNKQSRTLPVHRFKQSWRQSPISWISSWLCGGMSKYRPPSMTPANVLCHSWSIILLNTERPSDTHHAQQI